MIPLERSAKELHEDSLVWDQHGCLPLIPSERVLADLTLYRDAGVDFASINVGCDFSSPADSLAVAKAFHRGVQQQPDQFRLVSVADDVLRAKAQGRMAVAFDLEGAVALNEDLSLIETYSDLGVRTMLLVYNRRNAAGGGCHDTVDTGLSEFGRAVITEMNRIGMVVDASHCSRRTSLEACTHSRAPVIFSHSNPRELADHERNITDEQIIACAETGGVVGINGVSLFLPRGSATIAAVLMAINHVVELVGPQHVGLGLDYVVDRAELDVFLAENPDIFPPAKGYGGSQIEFLPPSSLIDLTTALLTSGYAADAVRGILGENFLRVATQVWDSSGH